MIHKCPKCNYLTTLKSNLTRHVVRKHPVLGLNEENIAESGENIAKTPENIAKLGENIANNKNHTQCERCTKILSCKKTLMSHIKICKGVKNPLECHNCNIVFINPSAKSRHLKSCTERALITVPQSSSPQSQSQPTSITNNNTTNNTTNIIENQTNTINNTNITIIAVDPNKLDELAFVTDHITNPELKKILKLTHKDISDEKKVSMIETYMRHLMTNPVNKCIQKTNMQNCFSKVHIGEDNWEVKHDKELYPKLTCNVAQGFSGLMVERNEETNMIKTERKLEELRAFLDYMSDEGYRNDSNESINHQTHLLFKELVQRIKGVVFEVTKISI